MQIHDTENSKLKQETHITEKEKTKINTTESRGTINQIQTFRAF